jgi:hypothetical protein
MRLPPIAAGLARTLRQRWADGDNARDFKGMRIFWRICAGGLPEAKKMAYNFRLDGALAQSVRAMES